MRYSEGFLEFLNKKYGAETVSKFEAMFSEIDPEVIALEVDEVHRQAFCRNDIKSEIGTAKEFYESLGVFYQRQCLYIGKHVPDSIDECIEEAKQYLGNQAYSAFKNAQNNEENGFYGTCEKIMNALLNEARIAFIKSKIRTHLSMCSYPEKAMFAEYLVETRMSDYGKDKKKTAIINISQDIDFWAQRYVEMLEQHRHG